MKKYLFTDGTSGVREAESEKELQQLIDASADLAKIRIWIFSASEWIGLDKFRALTRSVQGKPDEEVAPVNTTQKQPAARFHLPSSVRKLIAGLITVALVFLVYNFTRLRWTKAAALSVTAGRPANSPLVDADSIIQSIENLRYKAVLQFLATDLL